MCQLSLSLFLSRPCRFKFCRLKIFQFLKRHFNRSGCFTGEDAVKVVLTHPIPREGWLVLVLPPAHVVEPGPPNHVVLFNIFAHAFVLESNPSFDWLNILLLHVTYYSSPPPSSFFFFSNTFKCPSATHPTMQWLVKMGYAKDEKDALNIGNSMIEVGVVFHIRWCDDIHWIEWTCVRLSTCLYHCNIPQPSVQQQQHSLFRIWFSNTLNLTPCVWLLNETHYVSQIGIHVWE